APLSDAPAAKAGIKAGDIILQVDDTKSSDMGFNNLINKIRGPKGTTVNIQVARSGVDKPLTFSVARDTITVKSVTWEEKDQGSKKIMYVKVRQFGDDTDALFADFVAATLKAKPDGIIVDLRDNPGGYFESAINLSSYFIDGGTVVEQQDKNGKKQDFSTIHTATLKGFETAILVNGGSASASEIFSGAVQDRKVGKIIGEKTFGKGSVQELVNLSDGSAVKVTIAKWLTPNGRQINKEGIAPDIEIKNSDTDPTDLQLNRALDFIVSGK
ncbi:MAG: S41 family peptidase, partial [bacterium]|nr:S41 family peptidase [bacterium]